MTIRWVRRSTLARLLRLHAETVQGWQLTGHYIANEHHYSSATINAFLASCAHTFPAPPTIEELLHDALTLLTPEEAADYLNLKTLQALHYRRQTGQLYAICLGSRWRFSKQSVETWWQQDNDDELLPRPLAEHILGIGTVTLAKLVKHNRLQSTRQHGGHITRPITQESLLNLLQQLLPAWVDPRDWVDDRLQDHRPLVSLKTAVAHLGTPMQSLQTLLHHQHIGYIHTPHGKAILIAPEAIDAYLQYCEPLSKGSIATLFGVTTTTVDNWLRAGKLTCPVQAHGHTTPLVLYPACLVAVLRERLAPDLQPVRWYRLRLQHGGNLLNAYQAATALGMPLDTFLAHAEQYQVRGLLTPGGRWMFAPAQIAKAKRRLKGAG